jgi:hypothetical protein
MADARGAAEADVAWLTTPTGPRVAHLSRRTTTNTDPLYATRENTGEVYASTYDGTTTVATGLRAVALDTHEQVRAGWRGAARWVRQPEDIATGGYDLSWNGGDIQVGNVGNASVAIRDWKLYAKGGP